MPLKSRLAPLFSWLERILRADVRYLLYGNFWLFAARFVSIGFGVAISVAFANLLTPDAYGLYKYVISIAGIVSAFSLTGLVAALTNSIARGDIGVLRTTFWSSFRWNLLASAITLGCAGYYAWQGNMTLAVCLLIVAACNPFVSTAGNYRALFLGLPDFKAGALWGIPRSFFPTVVMLATVLVTRDPVLLIAAYFVSSMLTALWLYARAVRRWQVPKTAESTESTLRFARYASGLAFFSQITSQVDQFLVWHFVGPAGVAFYSFATSPIEQLMTLSANITTLVTPKFARKETDHEVHASLPLRMLQMFVVLLPITLAYILAAPFIFKYLFPQYVGAVLYSQIYALVLLVQPVGLVDAALIARENVGMRNIFIVLCQVIKLILLFIGIAYFGILGGIVALIASEFVNMIVGLGILAYVRLKKA